METDDQSNTPTKPASTLGEEESLYDAMVGGGFVAGHRKPAAAQGSWQPPLPEELQHDFPQYEITAVLGRGGMGAVYKGWQMSLDRVVAIKILPPRLVDGASDFSERFKHEAKAMAQLKHPGIVAVHDAGTTPGGLLYFIMECVEGTDLQRVITERGRIEPGEALRITGAVCAALAYAHGHGVIHRDIKPSNIMMDASGDVKVADFGLAKSTAPGTTVLTVSKITMGTPDFMAPEALHGAAHVDHRADIYAVGVMLYQMLTGKLPRGKYDPPSRIVPGLDRRLDRIVDRALQPERTARYASASEMGAVLAPISRSIARRAPAGGGAGASRKMPALVALAAVAGVAVLLHFAPWKKGGGSGVVHSAVPAAPAPAAATKAAPFVNTLGQEFVPVPVPGVLFCRWETRVRDYAEFAKVNTADDSWTKKDKEGVPVSSEPEQPVAGVSWEDAQAFCKWLTAKESADGKLPKGMRYRLPSDEEWSRAAGLAQEDGASPKERSKKNDTDFPWGREFPPAGKVGNYADSAFHRQFPKDGWLEGYADGFATTAPVGSFAADAHGIHDLGGNVWEWCEDIYEPPNAGRVLRGGSWVNSVKGSLLTSARIFYTPEKRQRDVGFRTVLDMAGR